MKRNVLIIGASGGIGKETAKAFIAKGYNVFGCDIKDDNDIQGLHYYKCDITKEDDINNLFININKEIDELYALIHVAGIYFMDSLLEVSEDELKRVIDINFLGATRINRIFFPLLKKGSRIMLTSSEVAPLDPLPFNGIYAMIKTLVEKYAFSLRMEVNMFDIKVIVLRPGAIDTGLLPESSKQVQKLCDNTKIHKASSKRFMNIVNKIETKSIKPEVLAKFIVKIVSKKNPRYVYKKNNNILLKLLNLLPDHLETYIITKIIK